MTSLKNEIKLSKEELAYLESSRLLTELSSDVLVNPVPQSIESFIISINAIDAEALRTVLTEKLAKEGFDENYDLTKQGELLEELIDRFYLD